MTPTSSFKEEKIVVYHLFRRMPVRIRMVIAFLLITGGFAIQLLMMKLLPGVVISFMGMLLLLVKGYSNKVNFKGYDPSAKWEVVERSTLEQVLELNRNMKKWARSATGISSGAGVLLFFLLLIGFGFLLAVAYSSQNTAMMMVVVNAALLILPFWFSGNKRVLTTPRLVLKIESFLGVIDDVKEQLADHPVDYYLLKLGSDQKVPDDVKLRIQFKGQSEGFMGMYAQISINSVNGSDYPYFYVVFVAKKDFGLKKHFDTVSIPFGMVKEYEENKDVEVMVVRQLTTKTTGYHTVPAVMSVIFRVGMKAGETCCHRR
jgi:hypothetical protein